MLVLVAAIAFPIWQHHVEYRLFRRQAVLGQLALQESWLRRLLWHGSLMRAALGFFFLAFALLFAALATLLKPAHWALLAADAGFMALLLPLMQARLARHAQPAQVAMASRQAAYWVNLAVLAAGFLAVDFWIVEAPDTRGLSWSAVAEGAVAGLRGPWACRGFGWLVGLLAAADHLAWHLAQVLVPAMQDPKLRLVAWIAFLLRAGVVAAGFTAFVFGAVQVAARLARNPAERREVLFPASFFVPAIFMAVIFMGLIGGFDRIDDTAFKRALHRLADRSNPCHAQTLPLARLESQLAGTLARAAAVEKQRSDAEAARQVDAAFADVGQGVDKYLDWYFSVGGDYQRLAARLRGRLATEVQERLTQNLVTETNLGPRLDSAAQTLHGDSVARMNAVAGQLDGEFKTAVAAHPCWLDRLQVQSTKDLARDRFRMSVAATAGTAVALATVMAKITSELATHLAARGAIRPAIAVAERSAIKRGGSLAVEAVGASALCGPFALVCGVTAGLITWFAIDKALITADEFRFRKAMREEILAAVEIKKAEVLASLNRSQGEDIDAMASEIGGNVHKTFLPSRDGV